MLGVDDLSDVPGVDNPTTVSGREDDAVGASVEFELGVPDAVHVEQQRHLTARAHPADCAVRLCCLRGGGFASRRKVSLELLRKRVREVDVVSAHPRETLCPFDQRQLVSVRAVDDVLWPVLVVAPVHALQVCPGVHRGHAVAL